MLVFAAGSAAQSGIVAGPVPGGRVPMSERLRIYAHSTAGPGSLLSTAALAGLKQWLNRPPEWGQGMAGYGRRFGYKLALHTVSSTIEFGFAALLHEDPRYYCSGQRGAWRRLRYAIGRTFLVPREGGGRTFAASRFIGAYGGAFLSNAWQPPRLNDPGDAMRRGSFSIAGEIGNSIFKEFWPDLKGRLLRRSKRGK